MFINTKMDLAMVAVHGLLSVSSLIFHIPRKRHAKLPMIYPEFRLHSIAFGMRSVLCCFTDFYGGTHKLYYKMAICIATMMIADKITHNYAESGDTTMRAMPFSESITDDERRKITTFHSNQQVSATLFVLHNVDTAFSPLFAIQMAAFFMTMVRKGIIRPNTWHLLYSWTLMINIACVVTMSSPEIVVLMMSRYGFRHFRMKRRMNKYVCWLCTFVFIGFANPMFMAYLANSFVLNRLVIATYVIKNVYTTRALYKKSI